MLLLSSAVFLSAVFSHMQATIVYYVGLSIGRLVGQSAVCRSVITLHFLMFYEFLVGFERS